MAVPLVPIAIAAAARIAAKKVASNAVKKAATKKLVAKTAKKKKLAEPSKASVKVKPAAKQVGNPRNDTKALENYYSSISRGGAGAGPAGKAKDARVHKSKNPTANRTRSGNKAK
jgi:hypothetical protein